MADEEIIVDTEEVVYPEPKPEPTPAVEVKPKWDGKTICIALHFH